MYSANPSAFKVLKADSDPTGIHSGDDGRMYMSLLIDMPSHLKLTLHIYVSSHFGLYKALYISSKMSSVDWYVYNDMVADFRSPFASEPSEVF
jgi:hypothetical protein